MQGTKTPRRPAVRRANLSMSLRVTIDGVGCQMQVEWIVNRVDPARRVI
jgi:hypothetical protein